MGSGSIKMVTQLEIVQEINNQEQNARAKRLLAQRNPLGLSGLVKEISGDVISSMDSMLTTDLPGTEQILVNDYATVLEQGHSYEGDPLRGSRLRVLAYFTLMCEQK